MYIINEYQLLHVVDDVYLSTSKLGAKIPHPQLIALLHALKLQKKMECTEEQLIALAQQQQLEITRVKKILIDKLHVLKPMQRQKIPLIYINSDDELIAKLLQETLEKEYTVLTVPERYHQYDREGLLIFYRTNYSDKDFQTLYQKLPNKLYLITAGVIHQLLMIDNLYFLNSGLPTHFSNLQHLMSYLNSDIPATKNNWLLFYRELTKKSLETFPTPNLNSCQRAYIAYCLHRFVAQYTDLWSTPTPLDQINCCWQADLNNFSIHTEAALHSPFSEYDMRLNLPQVQEEEMV
ncbi:MAG: McbB family protein [Legionella sp.]|nr:McbB family protein [Legionella sp.]